MGKKATILYTRILFQVATIAVVVLTIFAWLGGIIPPHHIPSASFISLGMTPLLITNLIIAIIWTVNKSWWAVPPIAAILLNIGFITAMINIDQRAEDKLPATDIAVASYNIRGYAHTNFGKAITRITDFMKNDGVDVLCMQEYNNGDGSAIDSLDTQYQYRIAYPQNSNMALGIYSTYPIKEKKIISFPNSNNCAMWADVEANGSILRVFNIHFQTTNMNQSKGEILQLKSLGIEDPKGKQAFDVVMSRLNINADKRAEQVNIVRAEIEQCPKDRQIIVCGDFNDTPASYAYSHIKQGLNDGFKTCGSGYGYTYKSLYKLFRIDYILYDKRLKGVKYYSPNARWSDHNPIILKLAF